MCIVNRYRVGWMIVATYGHAPIDWMGTRSPIPPPSYGEMLGNKRTKSLCRRWK